MKTIDEHIALHSDVETSARSMQGVWVALATAGHFGLAVFAKWEADERRERAGKIAEHLVGNGVKLTLPAISAPLCEYETPVVALDAMLAADALSMASAKKLVAAMSEAGENPFFQAGLLPMIEKDMIEIRDVIGKVKEVTCNEEMLELDTELLMKYSGDCE